MYCLRSASSETDRRHCVLCETIGGTKGKGEGRLRGGGGRKCVHKNSRTRVPSGDLGLESALAASEARAPGSHDGAAVPMSRRAQAEAPMPAENP
eukprot:1191508-Pyramimonas_sp.AAC.1